MFLGIGKYIYDRDYKGITLLYIIYVPTPILRRSIEH